MIEVSYNEYKEMLAQNMKLIIENHDLKEKISKTLDNLNNINVFEISEDTYEIIMKTKKILEGNKREQES